MLLNPIWLSAHLLPLRSSILFFNKSWCIQSCPSRWFSVVSQFLLLIYQSYRNRLPLSSPDDASVLWPVVRLFSPVFSQSSSSFDGSCRFGRSRSWTSLFGSFCNGFPSNHLPTSLGGASWVNRTKRFNAGWCSVCDGRSRRGNSDHGWVRWPWKGVRP